MRLYLAIFAIFFLGISRVVDSNEYLSSARPNRWLEEQCRKNGGPYAFDNFENIAQQFRNCVMQKMNLDLNGQQTAGALSMISLVKDLCVKRTEVDACLYNSAETAQACFDAEDQKSIKTLVQILRRARDYLCKNNAEELLAFLRNGAGECWHMGNQKLAECVEVLNSRISISLSDELGILRNIRREMNVFDGQKLFQLMKFDAEQCSNFDMIEECYAKEIPKCKYPGAGIVTNVLAAVKKETPCSGSSRGSAIPSVLIFVVTLTLAYLPFV